MAVSVEMHNTGDPSLQVEISAVIEHVLFKSQETGEL